MQVQWKKINEHNYIVSTPSTRKLVGNPRIAGVKFSKLLRKAVIEILQDWPFEKPAEVDTNVLTFLRGGLNFGLREALYDAWGYNEHSSSFISSQRHKIGKRWMVTEQGYRTFTSKDGATVFIGEIVATGITLKYGIPILLKQCQPKHVYLFTIGCINADKQLSHVLKKRNYTIIYLEGMFNLAKNGTDLLGPKYKRCVIGDGGERAFNPYNYLGEIR